jgi:ATP-binding cassette subfamily F protein uup
MHVYGYLKNFLFPREYLEKKIGVLSGGEKNRIALALLFTKQVDIMILDEPTNDLDIPTINILEEKLQNFAGAVIIVSHDRYFVDKIAKKLLIFKGEGHIEESFQEYSEYLDIEKALKTLAEYENSPEQKKAVIEEMAPALKKEVFKLSYKEKEALKVLPDKIERLENEIEELNQCLANPDCYQNIGLSQITQDLQSKEAEYEKLIDELLHIEEKVEMINAK